MVLATGGIGQVFASSTNPTVATGDGLALGIRAGQRSPTSIRSVSPTVLWVGSNSRGQQPLISEALRGEAQSHDDQGERFLVGQHPMAELAPAGWWWRRRS